MDGLYSLLGVSRFEDVLAIAAANGVDVHNPQQVQEALTALGAEGTQIQQILKGREEKNELKIDYDQMRAFGTDDEKGIVRINNYMQGLKEDERVIFDDPLNIDYEMMRALREKDETDIPNVNSEQIQALRETDEKGASNVDQKLVHEPERAPEPNIADAIVDGADQTIISMIAKVSGIICAVFCTIALVTLLSGHWIIALVAVAPSALISYEIYALAGRIGPMLQDEGMQNIFSGNFSFPDLLQDTLVVKHIYTFLTAPD